LAIVADSMKIPRATDKTEEGSAVLPDISVGVPGP
jgi:hypothetical protein